MRVRIIISFIAVLVIALWYYIFASPDKFSAIPKKSEAEKISLEDSAEKRGPSPLVATMDPGSPPSLSQPGPGRAPVVTHEPAREARVREGEIPRRKVARVEVSKDQVAFHPNREFAGYTLKVSGPSGYSSEQVFASYDTPTFSVPGGHNGLYKYELVGIPFASEQQGGSIGEQLNNGRTDTGSQGASASGQIGTSQESSVEPVQSGTFSQNEEGTLTLNNGDHGFSDQDIDNL